MFYIDDRLEIEVFPNTKKCFQSIGCIILFAETGLK